MDLYLKMENIIFDSITIQNYNICYKNDKWFNLI